MGYRFRANATTMTESVRQIAASEFADVRRTLADKALPLDRKVHECRKSTKRLRALIRLAAPVLPEARSEIDALSDAAGRLSAMRDKGAVLETLSGAGLPPAITETLNSALTRRRAASQAAQKRLLAAFAVEMDAAAERAQSWTLSREGWDALAPGLERSYRRLRKSIDAARRATDEEPVHRFRKRAKDHWYHTLLLRSAFPDVMDGYAAAAERLCDDLGDWRDLGLLEAAVQEVPAHLLAKPDAETALTLIARSRRRSLRRAFRTARRLSHETPRAYSGRIEAWWKTRG